jgi:hypothetical protein
MNTVCTAIEAPDSIRRLAMRGALYALVTYSPAPTG